MVVNVLRIIRMRNLQRMDSAVDAPLIAVGGFSAKNDELPCEDFFRAALVQRQSWRTYSIESAINAEGYIYERAHVVSGRTSRRKHGTREVSAIHQFV